MNEEKEFQQNVCKKCQCLFLTLHQQTDSYLNVVSCPYCGIINDDTDNNIFIEVGEDYYNLVKIKGGA